jgi:tetratricopeptide (TPR) repeat protein
VDRGDAYAAKGDTARAVADYEAALDKNSRYAPAYLKLGMLYQGQQRWREAESAYLKCVEADPSNVVAYNNLAWMAAEQKRRPDDALAWARKAVELAPKSPAVRDTLAWVHRNRGELKEAQSVLEKAASMSPPHAGVQYRLGVVYSEQGRERDALAAFEKALDIEKSFPEAEEARRRIAALKKR